MRNGLDSTEMELVGTLFQEAIDFLFQSANEKTKKNVLPFMIKRILGDVPTVQMSPNGVKELRNEVYNNVEIRDFLLNLSFVFFSRWAASDEKVLSLAANLARGLSQGTFVGDNIAVSAVPDEVSNRLSKREDVFNLLASNQWLICVIMMPLFMSSKSFMDHDSRRPFASLVGQPAGPTPE